MSSSRRAPLTAVAAGSIALAVGLAYGNALHGPFLYDDEGSVLRNPSLQHWLTALRPPAGGWPTSGRPVFNLSLALNYALSGLKTDSYHVLSILIHLAAAWLLFGLVRRTLSRIGYEENRATGVSWAVALIWAVHPLLTEAVTYISQRSESLMGLFFLLTLYAFEKGSRVGTRQTAQGPSAQIWLTVSVVACALGMASKEVMVTVPVIVLLYDRVFVARTWRGVMERKGYYLALAATWIELAALMHEAGTRGGTAGFGTAIPWWAYAMTQFRGIADYLRLAIWPHPLLFSYGLTLGGPPAEVAIAGVVVLALAVTSLGAACRGSKVGFLGAWFFVILSPTSTVVPIATELIAEHRMYLSLAAVVALVVCVCERRVRAVAGGADPGGCGVESGTAGVGAPGYSASVALRRQKYPGTRGLLIAVLVVAVAEVVATRIRNRAYNSVLTLWGDTVAASPDDAGARNNYGNALAEAGQLDAAAEQFEAALRLVPDYDDPHFNLANTLVKLGRPDAAISHYQAALRVRPDDARLRYGLGSALHKTGHDAEALREYQKALAGESDASFVWYDLGNALLELGQLPDAKTAFAHALRIKPDYPDALVNYAGVLAQTGDTAGAIAGFQAVLKLEPNAADVRNNLGGLFAESGRLAEAEEQFKAALAINPDYREARDNLARVQAMEAPGHP
ncbi:MAG TPA: tetratricopeptide repeat protein [Opitutaceae bacterium]|jgi:tetratricopeptide (TPR) repeat protein